MKKRIALMLTLTLIFTMSFSSFVFAAEINYKAAQKNYKQSVKKLLEKQNQELYNNRKYNEIVKKEIVIDKLDDLETIKKSFKEPVVIYKETITLINYNNAADKIQSVGARGFEPKETETLEIDNTVIANFNATLSITAEIIAERKKVVLDDGHGSSTYAYRLKEYNCSWATDNNFTGADGAGVYKANIDIIQKGVDLSGQTEKPVDEEFTVSFDQNKSSDDYSKTYSHTEYATISPTGQSGGTNAKTTFYIIFAAGPGMTYGHEEVIEVGWGVAAG